MFLSEEPGFLITVSLNFNLNLGKMDRSIYVKVRFHQGIHRCFHRGFYYMNMANEIARDEGPIHYTKIARKSI